MDILEKLAVLTDAAKYDVACTSSGLHSPRASRPDDRILPEELYRGSFPELGCLEESGLHDGADD